MATMVFNEVHESSSLLAKQDTRPIVFKNASFGLDTTSIVGLNSTAVKPLSSVLTIPVVTFLVTCHQVKNSRM
jgi:hypothetical protein